MKKFLILFFYILGSSMIQGETYSYTFTKQQYDGNGTKTLRDINWTITGDGGYCWYDKNKGQQFGSGNYPYKVLSMFTSDFSDKEISIIKIKTSGWTGTKARLSVSVGGETFTPSSVSLNTNSSEYVFNGKASGNVEFSWTQSSSIGIFLKAITIVYTNTNEIVSKPIFSIDSNTFYETQIIELSSKTDGATIYYTTDGSTPDRTKLIYTGSIEVSETTTIKAIAVKDNIISDIVSATYEIVNSDYEKINLQNIKHGSYIIATYIDDKFYLMKNGNKNVNIIKNLSKDIKIDEELLFFITGDEEQGYQIINIKKNEYLIISPLSNLEVTQEKPKSSWKFSKNKNGSIKAIFDLYNEFISYTTSQNNFTTSLDEYTCPMFYLINENQTMGISDINMNENINVEYYNLQGTRIISPTNKGLYIKKEGNSVTKIYCPDLLYKK